MDKQTLGASLIGFTGGLAMTGRERGYEIRETCSLRTAIGEDAMFGGLLLRYKESSQMAKQGVTPRSEAWQG
jgi:hypothetical protein